MAEQKAKKEWYKRWWAITIFVLIGLSIIGSLVPDDNSSSTDIPTETNTQNTQQNNEEVTQTESNQNINEENYQSAIVVVGEELTGLPDLNIKSEDLEAIDNPKGEGVFVYVPKTDFYGVERFFLWLYIENNAYAINGATKDLTPDLSFPRDAKSETWDKTGLNKYSATEAIDIVFGNEEESSNSVSDMNAIEMMEVAFIGGHSEAEIKTLIDQTMKLYSLPINEENYQRLGSVLVSLRKETGVSEMDILKCMKAADYKNTIGEDITAEKAVTDSAAICATTLSS